jgi:hypothetical protein
VLYNGGIVTTQGTGTYIHTAVGNALLTVAGGSG